MTAHPIPPTTHLPVRLDWLALHREDIVELQQLTNDQLVYRVAKPQRDGRTELRLSPLELLERLAALIPPRPRTATAPTA